MSTVTYRLGQGLQQKALEAVQKGEERFDYAGAVYLLSPALKQEDTSMRYQGTINQNTGPDLHVYLVVEKVI